MIIHCYVVFRYILNIDTAEDLEEYMLELLDGDDSRTHSFIKELLLRWRPYKNFSVPNAQVCISFFFYLKSFLLSGYLCRLLKTISNRLDSNQDRQNVGLDLDLIRLML